MIISYTLPGYDRPPLSLNGREHWAVKAREAKQLRQIGFMLTRNELARYRRSHRRYVPALPLVIDLIWHVADRRRRDADNPFPTRKHLVDGIADALGIDDHSGNVSGGVEIVHDGWRGLSVRIADAAEVLAGERP